MKPERNERTSPRIASLAAKGWNDPGALTPEEIRSVCASALTQAPDRLRPGGFEPEPEEEAPGGCDPEVPGVEEPT